MKKTLVKLVFFLRLLELLSDEWIISYPGIVRLIQKVTLLITKRSNAGSSHLIVLVLVEWIQVHENISTSCLLVNHRLAVRLGAAPFLQTAFNNAAVTLTIYARTMYIMGSLQKFHVRKIHRRIARRYCCSQS